MVEFYIQIGTVAHLYLVCRVRNQTEGLLRKRQCSATVVCLVCGKKPLQKRDLGVHV